MKPSRRKSLLLTAACLLLAACGRGSSSTPPPAASPVTVSDQTGVLFQDDFSDPASGWKPAWFEGSGAAHGEEYKGGEYRIWVDNDQNKYDLSLATPGKTFGDVSLEVEVRRAAGDEGASAYLMCRVDRQAASFYYFSLDGRNNASIGVYLDGEEQHVLWKEIPPEILKSDSNRLRADCLGSKLTVYVNGQLITETEETDLKLGDVGLGAGGGSQGMTDMYFDNFSVYPAPRPDLAASAVASPTPETASFEQPPPTGLIDVLYAGVDSGTWSYEQGLVTALQLLAGETELSAIGPEQPTSLEGTGIILEAQHYLRSGSDAQVKLEIERLLNAVAPAPERLMEYARPATAYNTRPPGHARTLQAEGDCSKLWEEGFPAGAGVQCLEYKEIGVGTSKVQLFYPVSQLVPGFTLAYADAALDSIKDAVTTYSTLAIPGQATTFKDIQIVFTLLESTGTSMLAMVPSVGGAQTCQIIVYPLSITDNEAAKTQGASSYGVFKQTLAHETFHCYQVWNFPALSDASWGVQDWWGEGSAEYFSNVVYPTVDSEWGFLNTWIVNSSVQSLVNMSYENFGFFQQIANLYGNNAILAMIKALPVQGGEQKQAEQLSKYPNMQFLFNAYARAFMDGKIADASGELLKTAPPYVRPEYQLSIAQAEKLDLSAAPFVISRYALTFEPGHLYALSMVTSGPEGFDSARPQDAPGGWGDIPAQIVVGCQPAIYYVLLTTTASPANELFNVGTTISVNDDVGCDECLVGTWDLDLPAFEDYLRAPFAGVDAGFFRIDAMGGLWRLHFSPQSTVTGEYNFLVTYELDQTSEGAIFNLLTQVVLNVDGNGTAQYLADGVGHISFYPITDNFNMEQTVFINGQEVPGGGNLMSGSPLSSGIAGTALYSCDLDSGVLYLTNELGGGTLAEPVKYNRISSTP